MVDEEYWIVKREDFDNKDFDFVTLFAKDYFGPGAKKLVIRYLCYSC